MDIKIKLKNILADIPNIKFAYLFGSYAKNMQNEKSDIDIALYLKNKDLDSQLQINYELSKELKKDIDLLILNDIKNLYLLDEVFTNRILIKDNDLRIDFELIKQHEIIDYKTFRKNIDAA